MSGRFVSRLKYLIVCGRVSSTRLKSSLVRLVTICPFLSRHRNRQRNHLHHHGEGRCWPEQAAWPSDPAVVCAWAKNSPLATSRQGTIAERKEFQTSGVTIVGVILLDEKDRRTVDTFLSVRLQPAPVDGILIPLMTMLSISDIWENRL